MEQDNGTLPKNVLKNIEPSLYLGTLSQGTKKNDILNVVPLGYTEIKREY